MDLKGSLVNTNLKLYPSELLTKYLQSIPLENDIPNNVLNFIKGNKGALEVSKNESISKSLNNVHFSDKDIENLRKIKEEVRKVKGEENNEDIKSLEDSDDIQITSQDTSLSKDKESKASDSTTDVTSQLSFEEILPEREGPYLYTSDIDWLYTFLEEKRKENKDTPYLHELLEGTNVDTPRNAVLKRNPVLEARCVKLRAQQEAREYRKMTRGVDNVRIKFPEDSIQYQLKQINRQLIAIGQFIISIFAGFLFGFKGVEWMIGPLDFGFKLLLGVMCALVIALAEIYFLAKKLNEELNVPETVQLGGPPQFVDSKTYGFEPRIKRETVLGNKEHQD